MSRRRSLCAGARKGRIVVFRAPVRVLSTLSRVLLTGSGSRGPWALLVQG